MFLVHSAFVCSPFVRSFVGILLGAGHEGDHNPNGFSSELPKRSAHPVASRDVHDDGKLRTRSSGQFRASSYSSRRASNLSGAEAVQPPYPGPAPFSPAASPKAAGGKANRRRGCVGDQPYETRSAKNPRSDPSATA
jgi:hypothetical protein